MGMETNFFSDLIFHAPTFRQAIVAASIVFAVGFCTRLFRNRRGFHPLSFPASACDSGGGDDDYCVVCLQEAVEGERFRKLPKCKHCFHGDCIEAWLQSQPTCPLCRNRVVAAAPSSFRPLGFISGFHSFFQSFADEVIYDVDWTLPWL